MSLTVAVACGDATGPYNDAPNVARAPQADAAKAAKPGSNKIVSIAYAAGFSTLLSLVTLSDEKCGTNFAATLSANEQFTVFAPTNAVFDALLSVVDVAYATRCDVLPVVLGYHMTTGRQTSIATL